MNQTLLPARISIPGRILGRELEARGWTQKDLANIMSRPPQTINEIVKGSKQITPETAIELSEALGTTAEFWTSLESKYQLHLAKKKKELEQKDKEAQDIVRKSKLYNLAPISEMIKRQWILKTDSVEELEQQFCDFFGILCPEDSPQLALNFRRSQCIDPITSAQISWGKRVENLARRRSITHFDRIALENAVPGILSLSQRPEDVAQVPMLLKDLGIHLIILPHLPKTYIDGAAFYLENNPVIALTLRYNRIDSFWFTLMHELGHIVAGHCGSYLDNMDDLAITDEEDEANLLAANWLVNSVDLKEFMEAEGLPSRQAIENFAQIQKRHPGIILGQLFHKKHVPHSHLRSLLVKIAPYLEKYVDT